MRTLPSRYRPTVHRSPFTVHLLHRIKRYLEEAPEDPTYGDFWVVAVFPFACYQVTSDVARRIRTALDRWLPPRWITFHDRIGCRVRIRTIHVRSITECTAEQRAAERRLERAREEEEKEDRRPWDDD